MSSTRTNPPRTDPGFAERLEALATGLPEDGHKLGQMAEEARGARKWSRDALSTALMGTYRDTASKEAFSLLYELNQEDFLRLIYHHLRRSFYSVDPSDVLQEVFFNVYRYPFKFNPDRKTAFRNWTHSIIRNTVLKHSRRAQRDHFLSLGGGDADSEERRVVEMADDRASDPLMDTAEKEAEVNLVGAWRLYLHFYLDAYRCLTPREKRVLYLVEVETLPYREAAARVEVRVENLKMMVFRARRKIFTIMRRKFQSSQDTSDRQVLATQREEVRNG